MVENIEELTPELQVYGFSNLGVFYHRKIEVVESRPHYDVTASIAEGQWQVRCKNICIEPAIDVVGP